MAGKGINCDMQNSTWEKLVEGISSYRGLKLNAENRGFGNRKTRKKTKSPIFNNLVHRSIRSLRKSQIKEVMTKIKLEFPQNGRKTAILEILRRFLTKNDLILVRVKKKRKRQKLISSVVKRKNIETISISEKIEEKERICNENKKFKTAMVHFILEENIF